VGGERRDDSVTGHKRSGGRDDGGVIHRVVPSVSLGELDLPADTIDAVRRAAQPSAEAALAPLLFVGPPGKGKTTAAEALASEHSLDLYRVDLGSVVSKWIGETEKNLRQIFDAAEQAGAILLFDEADALFGRRSDRKDAHDRRESFDVNYLFQRLESYPGIVIVMVNSVDDIDSGFVDRFGQVIRFPDD